MKKIFLAIFIAVSCSIPNARAQVCGGGYRTYHIFVRDGLNTVNPRYQLFAVTPIGLKDEYEATANHLSKTFFPNQEERSSRFWSREPLRVKSEIAETFLKAYDGEKYKKDPDQRWLRENKYSGDIKFAEIRFITGELYDRPMLLKIFADNYKPVYLLGDHFGGCSRKYNVQLEDYFPESLTPARNPPKQ